MLIVSPPDAAKRPCRRHEGRACDFVIQPQNLAVRRSVEDVIFKFGISEGKTSLARLSDCVVSLRDRLNIQAILLRCHIERRACTRMVNVALISQTKKFSICPPVINVSPERILPDAVIVLTLVAELLGNLVRRSVLISDDRLQHLGLYKSEAHLGSVEGSGRRGISACEFQQKRGPQSADGLDNVTCVCHPIKFCPKSQRCAALRNQYLAGGSFQYSIRVWIRAHFQTQCGGLQSLHRPAYVRACHGDCEH